MLLTGYDGTGGTASAQSDSSLVSSRPPSEADIDEVFKLFDDGLDVFAGYVAKEHGLDSLRDFLTGAIKNGIWFRFTSVTPTFGHCRSVR